MTFLNETLVNALCWTLVHSMWQGFVLALLAGLTILLTKKATSAFRYNTLAVLSLLFLVTVGITLHQELSLHETGQVVLSDANAVRFNPHTLPAQQQDAYVISGAGRPVLGTDSMQVVISSFLNRYAPWIVFLWFIVFSFKSFTMINGLRHVYRVRNYQHFEPSETWQHRLSELKALLKIPRSVRLLESRLVNVPSVTGFFKPIILVPIGLLNNLPQEQVEAILLHELAHIRRSDYLVNLLQRLMEIAFFFNPGVLWLSSLLKDERENCCDDMAVAITQNKRGFVNALVSFQDYQLSTVPFAMGFGAKKTTLLNRSKRLLYSSNHTLNTIEKSVLSIGLLLTLAATFAFSSNDQATTGFGQSKVVAQQFDNGIFSPDSDIPYADRTYNPDEIPEGTCLKFTDMINGAPQPTYLFKVQDTLYQISGDIRLFKINGKLIPQSEYKAYLPKIRMLMTLHRKQETELIDYLQETDPRKRSAFLPQETVQAIDQAQAVARRNEKTSTTTHHTTTTTTTTTSDGVVPAAVHEPAEVEESDPLVASILRDLYTFGADLNNEERVSCFKLSKADLIVNNIRQPEALQRQLKQHYIGPKAMEIYYNSEINHTTVTTSD